MIERAEIQKLLFKIEECEHSYDVVNNRREYRRFMPYTEDEYSFFYNIVESNKISEYKEKLFREYYKLIDECRFYDSKESNEKFELKYIISMSKTNFIAKECINNYYKLYPIEQRKNNILYLCKIAIDNGLKFAIEKYDYRRNSKISSFEKYAKYYIRGAFWAEIINNSSFLCPSDIKLYTKINKIIPELVQYLCKEEDCLTDFEIAIWWIVRYKIDEKEFENIVEKIITGKNIVRAKCLKELQKNGITEETINKIVDTVSEIRNNKRVTNLVRLDDKDDRDFESTDFLEDWIEYREQYESKDEKLKIIDTLYEYLSNEEKIVFNHCYKYGKYNSDLGKYNITVEDYYRILDSLTNKITKWRNAK